MAFAQKTWKDRVAEYINRRILTKEGGTTELVSVERSEGTISQEGDAFSADNMNDLEQRIADEFSELIANFTAMSNIIAEHGELLDSTITSDSGTVTKKVDYNSSTSVLVSFSKPFRTIPTVTIALTSCTNYQGGSMSGYITISTRDITKTGFVIDFKNSHKSSGYYANCTVSWNASA